MRPAAHGRKNEAYGPRNPLITPSPMAEPALNLFYRVAIAKPFNWQQTDFRASSRCHLLPRTQALDDLLHQSILIPKPLRKLGQIAGFQQTPRLGRIRQCLPLGQLARPAAFGPGIIPLLSFTFFLLPLILLFFLYSFSSEYVILFLFLLNLDLQSSLPELA